MMRLIFLLIAGIVVMPLNAQVSLREDSIMAIKGKWQRSAPFVHNYDAALREKHFPIIYKKLDSMAVLFREAYPFPKGIEAKWYPNITHQPLFAKAPSPYSFWSLYQFYYFNKASQKIMLNGETSTWAYVFVNSFNWLLQDAKLELNIEGKQIKIWKLPPLLPGELKGYPVYDAVSHRPEAKAIVITRNGKLPLKAVSQRQYLDALRKKSDEEYEKSVIDYDKGLAKNRKMMEDLKNKAGLSAGMKQSMIELAQKTLDKEIANRETVVGHAKKLKDKDYATIDEYVSKTPAAVLETQAVLNLHKDFLFYRKFEDPASKDAMRAVVIDQSYFDTTLASYEPQFMVLYWRWNNNGPGNYFREQLEANFQVEKLRAMIRNKNN